jgi:hypothetical protein
MWRKIRVGSRTERWTNASALLLADGGDPVEAVTARARATVLHALGDRKSLISPSPSPRLPGAAMLARVLTGESPVGGACPVATVVIPGGGKGDRPAGSPGVKVPVGWSRPRAAWSDPHRGASNLSGRSGSERRSLEKGSPPEADGGGIGTAEPIREW